MTQYSKSYGWSDSQLRNTANPNSTPVGGDTNDYWHQQRSMMDFARDSGLLGGIRQSTRNRGQADNPGIGGFGKFQLRTPEEVDARNAQGQAFLNQGWKRAAAQARENVGHMLQLMANEDARRAMGMRPLDPRMDEGRGYDIPGGARMINIPEKYRMPGAPAFGYSTQPDDPVNQRMAGAEWPYTYDNVLGGKTMFPDSAQAMKDTGLDLLSRTPGQTTFPSQQINNLGTKEWDYVDGQFVPRLPDNPHMITDLEKRGVIPKADQYQKDQIRQGFDSGLADLAMGRVENNASDLPFAFDLPEAYYPPGMGPVSQSAVGPTAEETIGNAFDLSTLPPDEREWMQQQLQQYANDPTGYQVQGYYIPGLGVLGNMGQQLGMQSAGIIDETLNNLFGYNPGLADRGGNYINDTVQQMIEDYYNQYGPWIPGSNAFADQQIQAGMLGRAMDEYKDNAYDPGLNASLDINSQTGQVLPYPGGTPGWTTSPEYDQANPNDYWDMTERLFPGSQTSMLQQQINNIEDPYVRSLLSNVNDPQVRKILQETLLAAGHNPF